MLGSDILVLGQNSLVELASTNRVLPRKQSVTVQHLQHSCIISRLHSHITFISMFLDIRGGNFFGGEVDFDLNKIVSLATCFSHAFYFLNDFCCVSLMGSL